MEVIPGSSIIIFTNRFVIFAPCWDLGGTKTPLASGDQEGYKGNSWGAGVEYQENCFEQNTLKRYILLENLSILTRPILRLTLL